MRGHTPISSNVNIAMAPRQQHTFTLVPNPLGMQGLLSRSAAGAPQGKPPMTSKQAQKLYREANRGPRLSKAEQRRIEREEQERIRRELDKEKQANKARALREKKKAKEQLILDDKKKKGLPLVNVRPSQDTIARFARGNGLGKKRDSVGATVIDRLPGVREEAEGDNESATEDRRGDHETRESKRRRLSQHGSPGGDTGAGTEAVSATTAGDTRDVEKEGPRLEKTGHEKTKREAQAGLERSNDGHDTGSEEEPRRKEKLGKEAHIRPAAGSSQPSALFSAKPLERTVQPNSVIAAHEPPAKETLARTPVIPPRQRTPAPDILGHEKTRLTTPKSLPSEPDVSPMTRTTPVNKPVQTPKPPLPSNRALPPPPQQRQFIPNPPPGQHLATRKALQETTNASNRARPVSVSAGTSSFASPYKPALATPQRPIPAPVPAFKQSRPETPVGRVQKPQFLPPHLRSATTCQRPLSPASTSKPHAPCLPDTIPEPPTSTQLFVMSHLDDMFPSPSQEARELQGDAPAAVVGPTKPSPARPPFAARPAPRPRLAARQVTHVNASMAPPPRPAAATRAAAKPTETPFMPFISTQDLFFSSQDMRDLEEPITTPSRARCPRRDNHAPPFKPRSVVERPSPLSRSPPRVPVTEGRESPACSGQPRQQSQGQGKAAPKPANITQVAAMQPPALPKPTILQNSRPALPASVALPDAPQQAPPRPASPEKPRFFGSSGSGAEMLLALDRSRKSYEVEERKRRTEPREMTEGTEKGGEQKEELQKKVPETGPAADSGGGQGRAIPPPPGPPRPASDNPGASSQHKASQETDYGDAELDSLDFDDLGLDSMEAVPKPKAGPLDNEYDDYDFNDADDMWDM